MRGEVTRLRLSKIITLSVIYPKFIELIHNSLTFHILGNSFNSHDVSNFCNSLHHCDINRIVGNILNKIAVNFEIINRQAFQVSKGRHPAAEVVQGKLAAEFLELPNQAGCLAEISDRHGFCNFKTNYCRRYLMDGKLLLNKLDKLFFVEAVPRKVD